MFLTGCASQVEKDHEANSLALVDEWLQALDNSDMDRAWDLTSNITKERFEKSRKSKYWLGIRKPMGEIIYRDFQLNWNLTIFKGNIPDGIHRNIIYWSKYKNRDLAKERFVVTLEDDQWRLIEWYVE